MSATLCTSETTIRDDEHRTYACDKPTGHTGEHAYREEHVSWTDATTVHPDPGALTDDERTMALVANYVDEWRRGDNAGHAIGHLREVFAPRSETARTGTASEERKAYDAGVDAGFAVGINESHDHAQELLVLRKVADAASALVADEKQESGVSATVDTRIVRALRLALVGLDLVKP